MAGAAELDPLLRDFAERKKSFQKGVASIAAELRDARRRLAQAEECLGRETLRRQAAEGRARSLEEEVCVLRRCLENSEEQLRASASSAEKYKNDVEVLRSELQVAQAAADESLLSVQSAKTQYLLLLKELDEKNKSFKEQKEFVKKIMEHVGLFRNYFKVIESSQKQLKDDVARIEKEILIQIVRAGAKKDGDLRKIFAEVSPKTLENIKNNMKKKDEVIALPRDEFRSISGYWMHETKELELKLEKHLKADQELRKRVLKIEFHLQEACSQTKKPQMMDEMRDKDPKDLKDQLATQQQEQSENDCQDRKKLWEHFPFKVLASMSVLGVIVFTKR